MKKYIATLIIAALLLSSIPISAANSYTAILINETYDNIPTNMTPSGADVDGEGSIIRIEELNKNKYVLMANQWSDTTVSYPAKYSGKNLWVEIRCMFKDDNTRKSLLTLFAANGNVEELAYINQKKEVFGANGQFLCKGKINEWITVSANVNTQTRRYDIYIDGKLAGTRIPLSYNFSTLKAIGYTSYANETKRSDFLVDYLRAYTAENLLSDSAFPKAEYNENSVKLRTNEIVEPSKEARIIFEQDFNKISKGNLATNLSLYGSTHQTETETADGVVNTFHQLIGGSAPYIDYNVPEKKKQFIVEGKFRVNKKNQSSVVLCMARDTNATFSTFVNVNAEGRVILHNNRVVGKEDMRKDWVKVSVALDFSDSTYDVYENGVLVAENTSFQSNALTNSLLIRIGPVGTSLDVDDIKVYTGTQYTVFEKNDSENTQQNDAVEAPYEIDKAPLKTNISHFTEKSQQVSDNPTSYLSNSNEALKLFANTICLMAGSANLWISGKKYAASSPLKMIDTKIYVPVRTLASLTGENVTWNSEQQKATIGDTELYIGKREIQKGGNTIELSAPIELIGGTTYVPAEEYVKYVMKKHYSQSDKGLIVIADNDNTSVKGTSNSSTAVKMMNYLAFDRPNAKTLQQTVLAASHPRAFAKAAEIDAAIRRKDTNPTLKEWSDNTVRSANEILNRTVSGHVYNDIILNLYWAYRVTGDTKYAAKAEAYALYMAQMNNWQQDSSFLITGAICIATSLAYDLFYDYLSEDSRAIIAKGIADKAISSAQDHYYGRGKSNWPQRDNNWNIVCNSGVIVGAIAIMDAYPELCSDVLEKALVSLEGAIHNFAPDGGWFEGVGYWEYTVEDMVMALAALEAACGTTYGITEIPGVTDTAYFPIYLSGNPYIFAYHDVDANTMVNTAAMMWFARKTQDMNMQRYRMDKIISYGSTSPVKDLVWYTEKQMPPQVELSLDSRYISAGATTMRSDWSSASSFVGIHAGGNSVAHGQLDIGDFDYEVWGTKFADEMCKDDYNLLGYFDIGGMRNNYYANRAEGQNVYVINPSENGGQITEATSSVKKVTEKPKGAIYTVDMTPAYANDVKDALRGFMLGNDRKIFTVQDEIVPKNKDDDYYWYWHTKCEITVNNDGKSVTLKDGWKVVKLYFDSNVDFEITAGKAEPYFASPMPNGQLKMMHHTQMNKITVNFLSNSEKVIFRATAVPYDVSYTPGELTPISKWSIPDGEIDRNFVYADSILVDGKPINGFYYANLRYDVFRDGSKGAPTITVQTQGNAVVEKYDGDASTYFVKVNDKNNPEKVVTYVIRFRSEAYAGLPQGTKFEPVEITASGSDMNLPVNVADGKLDTRWSADGRQWIQYDLGEIKNINAISMAVHMGHERKQYFKMEVSEDGVNYIDVLDSETTGTTKDYEHFRFIPVNARYVRITGYGNSTNSWNSITELGIYGN